MTSLEKVKRHDMTKLDKAKQIVAEGHCGGVDCDGREENECPSFRNYCGQGSSPECQKTCLDYIKSQEGNMDKTETEKAMERLDAIEREAQALRKIIATKPKMEYDPEKIYVGIGEDGCPYILTADAKVNYRFHSFDGYEKAAQGWSFGKDTGQECLEYHIAAGFEIRAFDDLKEALEFFMDHLD